MSDKRPQDHFKTEDENERPETPRQERSVESRAPEKPRDAEMPGSGEGVPTTHPEESREAGLWADAWRQLRKSPMFIVSAVLIAVFVVMALFPSLFTDVGPGQCNLGNNLQPPSGEHIFGTDLFGCDYYAKVVYGARVSVSIGLIVTTFAVLIAVTFGSLAGYYGGFLDTIIARITDVWFSIPFILGGIVAVSTLRNASADANAVIGALTGLFDVLDELFNVRGFGVVVFVLVILGWPTMLRLTRSAVLSTKESDYVEAARALGASNARIIMRHILPNSMAPVIVYATITVGVVIVAEASLSFLGVGLVLPANSWGLMINQAQNRILTSPHLLLFPGLFLSVTVFSFILMGDALRDALDPKLR